MNKKKKSGQQGLVKQAEKRAEGAGNTILSVIIIFEGMGVLSEPAAVGIYSYHSKGP